MFNKVLTIFVLLSLFVAAGCFRVKPQQAKRSGKIEGQAGRMIPFYSLSVDANYDPRLDNLIPGYKLLPVIMRNVSLQAVPMDAKKDRWILVGEKGQKYRAINSLRVKDPVLWREVPDKMRTMIDYPEILPINYNVTFDLLLPKRANLQYFRQIRYYNAAWKQEFVIEKEY
jgi:hypothetical protein